MNREGDSMWSWLIALVLGGLLFWMWLRQDQERMHNAREQAEDALRRAERAAKDTGDRLKSTLDEGRERVEDLVEVGRERAEDLVEAGRARATELKSQVDDARADVQRRAAEFRQDVEEQAGRVVDKAQDRLGDLREAVEERVDQVEDKAEDVVETAVAKSEERAEDLREKLEDVLRETRLGTTETSAVVPDEIPVAVDPDVVSKAHTLADQLREAHAAETRDDLARIDGIGERSAQALYKGGITTFAKLAALTDAKIRELLEAEGVRVHSSLPRWREQAAELAKEQKS